MNSVPTINITPIANHNKDNPSSHSILPTPPTLSDLNIIGKYSDLGTPIESTVSAAIVIWGCDNVSPPPSTVLFWIRCRQ
ncbi:hypothetical protein [Pelosinus propionicus]|uniref:hypothetical protein n=1 Tax=Pelosinus propionicus TaxID=380084 RepID=UPI00158790B5|nr:hypothetical protein [Pelosinus propionicus]